MKSLVEVKKVPRSLRDVAETLGDHVALRLMATFPGQEVYFPSKPNDDHPIIAALGKEAGYALCDFLAGAIVYVPNGKTGVRSEVLRLQAEGRDRREIASVLNVSQRHVRRVANKQQNEDQFDLFS
ncbi:hypothetical protein GOZ94_11215 [Agrobacterium vitis]|uniref:hypothetical protein n=1 Tax=Agrobacterium vitis TaxID=373 RepID=UPI0012E96767|nr:hypothetical protein [Agrobacterium vitis]MVA19518.1 hypothetical protein [Agrobacterium vitis]